MFDQQQPQQRPPSQQQQRIFVFTTALVNRAIDSNCSSLAEWHAQNIQQQPSTSAAPPPSMNHHPLEMSCGGMNFSLGQHPTAVLSPNVNNVNSAAATPTTTTATTTTTTKRATKRKIPHSNVCSELFFIYFIY
jgi:hypothetical protein